MRRAFLAVCAAYGLADIVLSLFPDAWSWARLLLGTALAVPMNLLLRTLERPAAPIAEISQDSWCKATFVDTRPWIRCNQAPGHAGPHAFLLPRWTTTPGAGR